MSEYDLSTKIQSLEDRITELERKNHASHSSQIDAAIDLQLGLTSGRFYIQSYDDPALRINIQDYSNTIGQEAHLYQNKWPWRLNLVPQGPGNPQGKDGFFSVVNDRNGLVLGIAGGNERAYGPIDQALLSDPTGGLQMYRNGTVWTFDRIPFIPEPTYWITTTISGRPNEGWRISYLNLGHPEGYPIQQLAPNNYPNFTGQRWQLFNHTVD